MAEKKIVHYSSVEFWSPENPVGNSATVVPLDHPDTVNVSNGQPATTSVIAFYDETTGIFETQNTVYVPA